MLQGNFLNVLHTEQMHESVKDWQVPDLPVLDGMDEIYMDLESTGLRWWRGDRMIGAGVLTPDGITRYLPIGHKVGPNIPRERFFTWVRQELRNKRIVNIRTKFDLHLFRKEGIDLEAQGCTFGDAAHYAALLDDHRRRFNQKELAEDFLGDTEGKVTVSGGYVLDMGKLADYPAGLVAARACHDVLTVKRLVDYMWPLLTAQGLHPVRKLEDEVIPAVVEMEQNGAPLDIETLVSWLPLITAEIEQAMWDVQRLTGCKLETPDKRDDIVKIFQTLRLELPLGPCKTCKGSGINKKKNFTPCTTCNATGRVVSFADDLLEPIQIPAIQRLRAAKQLAHLKSKLVGYYESASSDGILRYELHQLPYTKDEGGEGGAVSGRFSSARVSYHDEHGKRQEEGANIQQVFGVKTQLDPDPITKVPRGFTRQYLVKKLFIPAKGKTGVYTDASQLQFRLFAHYANSEKIIAEYQDDFRRLAAGEPLVDFHDVVGDLIKRYAHKDLIRTHVKNVNFAQVFGAGVPKMAEQLGVSVEVAQEISDIYHTMFPEVKPLLRAASHLGMPDHKTGDRGCGWGCRKLLSQGFTHRGFVRTFLGRRARFGPHDRHYSALNRIIQGTEGDVNKREMIEIHKQRHELGLTPRFTVHDAWVGDAEDVGMLGKIRDAFNVQHYAFRVPILWVVKSGANWASEA